jgi:hypothetical protein
VSSLTLVDADTFQPISQYNPIANGATINRATLPTQNLTIKANTSPATIGSVAFDLVDSGYLNTVNTAPYDLCGTAPCSNLGVGLHSLTTTPYTGPNASGGAGTATSISFSVIDPTPTPVPTPSPTPTPSAWPAGVPTPQPFPTVAALVSPVTVGPGTHGVVGNGSRNASTGVASGTDDTSAWQNLLNSSDVIVQAGTYLINGSITIPPGRNIQCQPGATFLQGSDAGQRMFQIGFYGPAVAGNNQIIGCTFEGTDLPAGSSNFANYRGGTSGYSELFLIGAGSGGNTHPTNILIENNAFKDGQGDHLITDTACGTLTASPPTAQCNGGAPSASGPSEIYIVNNTFTHCVQPGVHINGGQDVRITGNTFTDCGSSEEEDSSVLQVMLKIMFDHNTYVTANGGFDAINSGVYGVMATCTAQLQSPSDGHGCWMVQNTWTGSASNPGAVYAPGGMLTTCPNNNGVTGLITGNYYGNIFLDGSVFGFPPYGSSCGSSQNTVPYCNGGTCTTSGWLS